MAHQPTPSPQASQRSLKQTNPRCVAVIMITTSLMSLVLFNAFGSSDILSPVAPPKFQISLNTANRSTLQLLPGIGTTKSNAMINDRKASGPYRNINDLQHRISGIGPTIAKNIMPWVVIAE